MATKPVKRSVLSLEYVKVDVFSDVDPTGDAVKLALAAPGEIDAPTFHDGEWSPGQTWTSRDEPVEARCLFGPDGGAAELEPGVLYDVMVKVTDNPEVPVFTAYQILGV